VKRSFLLVIGVLLLAVLTVGLLAGCGGAAADETTTTAAAAPTTTTGAAATETTVAAATTTTAPGNYPDVVYPKMVANSTGGPAFDLEKWKATASAQKLLAYMRNSYIYKDEMDPALLAYWDVLGMKKEMHDADGDAFLKWASYTPKAALAADNTGVYPVVFCFHGAYGNIFGAEGYGIAEYGATAGYITVCAATHPKGKPQRVTEEGLTVGARIIRILDELEAGGYPIDRSRVYLTGQSMGGMTCAWAALEIPEVVTAIAMHGSAHVLNTDEAAADPQSAFTLVTPESDYAKAMNYSIPMYLECGDSDSGNLPLKTGGVINGLNLWLQMNQCPTKVTLADSLAAQASTTDPAVKLVGLTGDKTWTQNIDGVVYHGVDYFRADGVKMVEIVGVENCPHWVTAAYPELAWEFLSRFSKDAEGNLIVAE
jgi:pimeloyl-ACP methyl ester carboxylesterase